MKPGYFNNEKREYVIENMYPRRRLKNFVWNGALIADLDQFGLGLSKACIDHVFRPLIYDCRLVYIRDNETGETYDFNRNFAQKQFDSFNTHVGIGYHTVESSYKGLKSALTVLIPEQDLVEMHRVVLENTSSEKKTLSVFTYINPYVNLTDHQAYTRAKYDEELCGLYFAHRAYESTLEYVDVFYSCDTKATAWALSRDAFCGTYGNVENPEALKQRYLPCDTPVFEPNYAAALQFDIELAPGEKREFYFAVGTTRGPEETKALALKYAKKAAFEEELEKQRVTCEEHVNTAVVETPDEYLDTMASIWLKRQMALGKTWGRVYGKGFRDVLQDITGFVSLDVKVARERLLYTLKHQFINGNAIRMFDPIMDHPYQDMPAWIAPAVLAYLKESGDFSILDEEVGYYDDDSKDTVLIHVKRGVDFLFSELGQHGLTLWGGGDWNDSLNGCGMQRIGESVWLSIATVNCAADYIEILQQLNTPQAKEWIADIEVKREQLKANIRKHGFEGDRFLYGITDWGEKVGAEENAEGKIFLNPQTWAAMSDILSLEEKCKLMDLVEKRLKCDYGYVLQDPPFYTPSDHIGRVSYFEQGVYENASVYNHAVMFKVVADCCIGRGEQAWNTLKINRYDNPKNPDSGVEPYAISNMYFGPSAVGRKGYAPLSWITGSAGWMYRAIVEFLLGVKPDFNGLKLQPCLPESWNGAKIKRTFRGAEYQIELIASDKNSLVVDGAEVEGNIVPVFEKGSKHTVVYCYKNK